MIWLASTIIAQMEQINPVYHVNLLVFLYSIFFGFPFA